MKKLEKRSILCLILAVALLGGTFVYVLRFVRDGSAWASFPSNRHLYQNGILMTGRILDRDGTPLSYTSDGERHYHDDKTVRMATLHAVGDKAGNIGTGAQTVFSAMLSGYNIVTGVSSVGSQDLYLTLDADLCAVALNALNGQKGTVGVYNYKTGEILCMVSSPTFDPENAPTIEDGDSTYEGVYLNRLLSATFVPGSTFKLVTLAAALENISGVTERTFQCSGSLTLHGNTITCLKTHGTLTLTQALAVSCNCAFAQLSDELGEATLLQYANQAGLTGSYSVSGIPTAKGSFTFDTKSELVWGGIGQAKDLVNPCNLMVYMGAIANGGTAAIPQVILQVASDSGLTLQSYQQSSTGRLISADTAAQISTMMRSNVVSNYGEGNFPGLDICAKSGTAEVGGDNQPHAWFAGFLRDDDNPLAFVVLVENGGTGSLVAGSIANTVLQAAVK